MPSGYEPGEKFLRVFQLFARLSETDVGLTTAQLAAELEVTTRTVQRYIATLRDSAGIDIEENGGRFRIGAGTRLPPLQLDRYQATLLLVALRLLHQLRTEHDPAMVGALAQLSRALRVPLVVRYLERMLASAEGRPANPDRQAVERVVIDGFAKLQAIEVSYVDSKGAETRRTLRPYFIEPRAEGRHIYVIAHDATSRSVRTFRIDRIRSARLLPETFSVPDDFDVDEALSDSWSIWQGDGPVEVVLRFAPEAAQWVSESPWHASARITRLSGGGTEVRVRVASEVEMRPAVLRWTPYVEVVAPSSMRDYVAEALRKAAALYASDDGLWVQMQRQGGADDREREDAADGRGVARAAVARGIPRAAQGGHGAPVHRHVRACEGRRHVPLRRLRRRAVQVRNQVRLRYRLAQLLGADRPGRDRAAPRLEHAHAAH